MRQRSSVATLLSAPLRGKNSTKRTPPFPLQCAPSPDRFFRKSVVKVFGFFTLAERTGFRKESAPVVPAKVIIACLRKGEQKKE